MTTPLMVRIDGKRDDLIQLTQDLIRIPTLNPPGENYGAICDFLNKRLQASGFETQLIRAFDTPRRQRTLPPLEHHCAARWNIFGRLCSLQQPHRCG